MDRFFRRLGSFIENKHIWVVVVGLCLIIPSVFGAMHLKMETGDETFVSADSEVYRDYERFKQSFSDSVVVVLLTVDNLADLVQPDNMAAMQAVETDISARAHVVSAIGPAFFVSQAVAQQTGTPSLPTDPQAILGIITDPQDGAVRADFSQVLPDNRHALLCVTIDASLSQSEQADMIEEIKQTVAGAGFGKNVSVVFTGTPVFRNDLVDLMAENMRNMLLLSVGLMLLILAIIFNVRGFFAWRWLPLGVMFLGIIYCFGVMGVLSIPLTMVTMAAFPILVGLGVDYAIQFHNRCDEEARRGQTTGDVIIESVRHIGPTIGISIIVACLGFVALFFSPVPMIQDFGLMLIIGVTACYILSVFFLMAVLYWRGNRSNSSTKIADKKGNSNGTQQHFVDRGLHRIAPLVIKNPAIIIAVALSLTVAGLVADRDIETETDEMKFISQDVPVIQNINTLRSLGGGLTSTNLLVEAQDIADPAILAWMWQIEQRISKEQSEYVAGTSSIVDVIMQASGGYLPQDSLQIRQIMEQIPLPIRRNLVTDDYTAANIIVTNRETESDVLKELANDLRDYTSQPPNGVKVTVTGNTQILVKLMKALTTGREQMTLFGMALVFVGLFLLLRFRILRALLAILPILMIIGWSSGMMYLLGIKYTPVTATLGSLIIGIGVEFTVLLMMRYYEERDKGEDPEEAMTTSITKIGRAIMASGFTVIGGFAALLVAFDFPVLRDFGLVTMINVFFALLATLVVLPPLIVGIDSWRERRQSSP